VLLVSAPAIASRDHAEATGATTAGDWLKKLGD
jgi:hypothetical protein